ncbi:MAG: hypothetical protein K0B37_14500, partial [Bacteroidales bacterium]|nr:hypothetical protein [Bacteroidales bacterium]
MNTKKKQSFFPPSFCLLSLTLVMALLIPFRGRTQISSVDLNWLGEEAPEIATGVSWGVPFPENVYEKDQSFLLKNASDQSLPLQSWPLAYWPDGSLKWMGFSTVVDSPDDGTYTLEAWTPSAPTDPAEFIQVEEEDGFIRNNTQRSEEH